MKGFAKVFFALVLTILSSSSLLARHAKSAGCMMCHQAETRQQTPPVKKTKKNTVELKHMSIV